MLIKTISQNQGDGQINLHLSQYIPLSYSKIPGNILQSLVFFLRIGKLRMWRLSGLKLKWTTKFICGPMLHHRPHVLSLCLLPLPFSDVTFQFSKDKKFLFFQFCLFCSHGIYQLLPLSSRETRSTAQWPPSAGFFQRLLLKWGGRERKRD